MTRKGGGRESGGEATYEAGVGTLPTAAANTAACPFCDGTGEWRQDAQKAHGEMHKKIERIRELEAELAETVEDVHAALRLHQEDEARVKDLEGELAIHRGTCRLFKDRAEKAEALLRDASMQIRLMRDHNDEQKARVKELETIVKGKFTTLGEILHARESRSSPARKE